MSVQDRIVLVGIGLRMSKTSQAYDTKESLEELEELTQTAGGQVVGVLYQNLHHWNSATLIGSGKIEEIRLLLAEREAHKVIIDHELSGIQQRNLEKILNIPVLDRTLLILDIFAQRARSREGKLQVELAQLLDQKSRMVGAWLGSLSRLGGGIGTRGPGEKALEVDRRTLAHRIYKIRQKLQVVSQHRARHRSRRKKQRLPCFAVVGYTNAGKSSLFNCLTKLPLNAQVDVEDQLFATLDPTTRKVFLPDTPPTLVTDTVGFIRKLPTYMIEAFKATLEEVDEADALLHVVDFSARHWQMQVDLTMDLLKNLGWSDKPIIHVFNKIDKVSYYNEGDIVESPRCFVSSVSGEGMDHLKVLMKEIIENFSQAFELFFSLKDMSKFYELEQEAPVTKRELHNFGVNCLALLTPQLVNKWKHYLKPY